MRSGDDGVAMPVIYKKAFLGTQNIIIPTEFPLGQSAGILGLISIPPILA